MLRIVAGDLGVKLITTHTSSFQGDPSASKDVQDCGLGQDHVLEWGCHLTTPIPPFHPAC